MGLAGAVVEHAVLGDVQPPAHCRLAQRHVVLLGAGEVLQQIAELVGGDDPEVDLQPRVGPQPHAGLARGLGRLDQLQRRGGLGQRQRIGGGGDDVEVLDAVGHPAGRAGQLHPLGGGMGPQGVEQLLAHRQGAVEHDAAPAAVAVGLLGALGGDRGQDALLGLGAKALERADLLRGGGRLQGVERVDGELLEQPARSLGAQAGEPRDLQQSDRELGAQLDRRRDVALVGQRQDLLLDDRADARQFGGAPSRASAVTDTEASRTALAALR